MNQVTNLVRRLDPAAVGIAGVSTAAAVLSFSSLRALAISTNTWVWIAWLLPISLDAAAATATFVWLRSERGKVTRLAASIAWATIVLSVVGNAVHHAFQSLGIVPWWWVALVVGAVPPAVFGAVVHMAITAAKPDRAQPGNDQVSTSAEPQWSPPSTVTEPVEAQPGPEPEPVRQLEPVGWSVEAIVTDLREQGRLDAHQRYIRDTYRCGPSKANKVLDALRLEVAS